MVYSLNKITQSNNLLKRAIINTINMYYQKKNQGYWTGNLYKKMVKVIQDTTM